jgi:hypothetical protein
MFYVVWLQTALNELAAIWTAADSSIRQAITDATNAIDAELRINPELKGESRTGGRRIFFAFPLGVLFAIDRQRRTVFVTRVWDIRRRS